MRRTLIAFTLLSAFYGVAFAQQNSGIISGKLADSTTKKPLSFATITIYQSRDSALFTYRISDPAGNFKITGLPAKTDLRMIITFSGYRVFRKDIQVTTESFNETLGDILLVPDVRSIDEVLVYSERPPVIFNKDTIEFNASSFKTLPAALVEDLLKKLPGVDIDQDGNIVVNGKPVSRIMVDGKDFFGGDPKVATRNLPANIIDKVQVVEDKKELERNPLLLKNEISQVINLKLKKSIKKGWFGKAYAGAGSNDRNEGGAIINSFRDTLQVSALAFTNNLNKGGFSASELTSLGGFQRSGVKTMTQTSTGGIGVNGISFGGIGEGILRSSGGGINLNYSSKKNLNMGLMYFTGTGRSVNRTRQNTIQNLDDTVLSVKENLDSKQNTINHRLAAKIEWTIDTLTNLRFQPSLSFSHTLFTSAQVSTSTNNSNGLLYNSENSLRSAGNGTTYNHELFIGRRQKKAWPGFVLFQKLDLSFDENDKYTDALTKFNTGSNYPVNQLQDRGLKKLSSATTLNIMKVYSVDLQVNLSHSLTTIMNNDNLNVYEHNSLTGKYEVFNPTLSNRVQQSGTRNMTNLTFTKNIKGGTTLIGGIGLVQINLTNKFEKFQTVKQRNSFIFPRIGIYLGNTNITYSATATEPNAADLQPVIDNSDPVFQVLGNPELKPAVAHNFSISHNKYIKEKLLSVNFSTSVKLANQSIIRERWVENNGIQFTRPLNKDGIWNIWQNFSVRKQYKFNRNRSLSWSAGYNVNYTNTIVIVNKLSSRQYNSGLGPSASVRFNWKDIIEFSQSGNYVWTRTTYSSPVFRTATVKTFYYTADLVVRLPKKTVWESNIEYSKNNDITPGYKQSYLRWNLAVNYQFLENDKGNLRLSVFDLLKQNAAVTRIVKENYTRDTEQSVLTRYFLLTFTYNIRDFKAKKIGGRDSFFLF